MNPSGMAVWAGAGPVAAEGVGVGGSIILIPLLMLLATGGVEATGITIEVGITMAVDEGGTGADVGGITTAGVDDDGLWLWLCCGRGMPDACKA